MKDAVLGFDYCQAGLCAPNRIHIGCGATGHFGPNCPAERSLVPMTTTLISHLLQKHNKARCDIANGRISGYESANRMVQMVRVVLILPA